MMSMRSRCILLAFSVALPLVCGASELPWLSSLSLSLEKTRKTAEVLDSSRLGSGSTAPIIGIKTQAPGSYDGPSTAWSVLPRAGISLNSPGPSTTERVSWEISAGGLLDVRQESSYDPIDFFISPYISGQTTIRLAPPTPGNLPASEVLRRIELSGRKRGLEERALSGFLEVCTFASVSASNYADYIKAEARSRYLETSLRRLEVLLEGGAISRASYMEEKDGLERAMAAAADSLYEAGRLGREARARAGLAGIGAQTASSPGDVGKDPGLGNRTSLAFPPETLNPGPGQTEPSVPAEYFRATDLEALARLLEPLIEQASPEAATVETSTAAWDLRIAELVAESVARAPQISATIDANLGWNDRDKKIAPVFSGIIGLSIPVGSDARDRARRLGELKTIRSSVVEESETSARRTLAEARALLGVRKQRIGMLSLQYEEKARLASVYARLKTEGAVTEIDRLMAVATMREIESSLDRSRAGYFLDTVTMLVNLRVPMQAITKVIDEAVSAGGGGT